MRILVQVRDGSGWGDLEVTEDVEKVGRLLGYGDNSLWYRAVDPDTREPLNLINSVTIACEPRPAHTALDLCRACGKIIALQDDGWKHL